MEVILRKIDYIHVVAYPPPPTTSYIVAFPQDIPYVHETGYIVVYPPDNWLYSSFTPDNYYTSSSVRLYIYN